MVVSGNSENGLLLLLIFELKFEFWRMLMTGTCNWMSLRSRMTYFTLLSLQPSFASRFHYVPYRFAWPRLGSVMRERPFLLEMVYWRSSHPQTAARSLERRRLDRTEGPSLSQSSLDSGLSFRAVVTSLDLRLLSGKKSKFRPQRWSIDPAPHSSLKPSAIEALRVTRGSVMFCGLMKKP